MKQSASIAELAKALATVHEHMQPVTKDRANSHFKNRYATLDAIMESVRPLLSGHGLSIVQGGAGPISDESGAVNGVSVETMLVHTSGEWISSMYVLPLDRPTAPAVGSAITYGRRYGVTSLLAITTEDDDDGVAAMPSSAKAATTASSPAPATPAAPPATASIGATLHGAGDVPACPKCKGNMWDNRRGKRNPNAPDFKCKDGACDGVVWPPKDAAPKPPRAAAAARVPNDAPYGHAPFPDEAPF